MTTSTDPASGTGSAAGSGARLASGVPATVGGNVRRHPARIRLGLVSRPPSGWGRSWLSSKISRHRALSPRWVRARPNRVSPSLTVTTSTATDVGATAGSGAGAAGAATTVATGRVAGASPSSAWAVDPRGPSGSSTSTAATSRWASRPVPERGGGGASRTRAGAAGGSSRCSASWLLTSTATATTNRAHTSHTSAVNTPTTTAASSPIASRDDPGHGLPTTSTNRSGTPTTIANIAISAARAWTRRLTGRPRPGSPRAGRWRSTSTTRCATRAG